MKVIHHWHAWSSEVHGDKYDIRRRRAMSHKADFVACAAGLLVKGSGAITPPSVFYDSLRTMLVPDPLTGCHVVGKCPLFFSLMLLHSFLSFSISLSPSFSER